MLEAFDELGVKPAIIAGTSMGAICGAAYAAGHSGAELRDELDRHASASRRHFLKRLAGKLRGGFSNLWSLRFPGVSTTSPCSRCCCPTPCAAASTPCKIPFVAIAADFYAIEQVVLDRGPLIPALAASSALPQPRPPRGARRVAC